MKCKLTLTILLVLFGSTLYAGNGGHKRKVLIIGIDGCRSDALQQANTPNIDSLVAHGFYTYDSWHADITVSGPSWSSIMTGVNHYKHGVTGNSYAGSNFARYPYFTTLAKQVDPSYKCVEYVEWPPLSNSITNDGWDTKIIGIDGDTKGTGLDALPLVQDANTDVLFVYFDNVDLTGHSSGFSPTNAAYVSAVDTVDIQVGKIIAAMRARPTYAQEDWLVLLVTDHGGNGTSHGLLSYGERHIWWIGYSDRGIHSRVSGPQDTVALNNPPDPGTWAIDTNGVDTAKLHQSPVHVDIATTALHHLIYDSGKRPETDTAWALDGKSWLCEMGLCSDKLVGVDNIINPIAELQVKIYPNPSPNGQLTIWTESLDGHDLPYTLSDVGGKIVRQDILSATSIKHPLDLSILPKGMYQLTVLSNGQKVTKAVSLP